MLSGMLIAVVSRFGLMSVLLLRRYTHAVVVLIDEDVVLFARNNAVRSILGEPVVTERHTTPT